MYTGMFPCSMPLRVCYLQGFQHFFQHFSPLSRFSLHRPKLCHPRLVFFQVCGGHRFGDLFECNRKVLHGHGHLQLIFGEGPDLLRAQALDSPSHRHHGGVSDEERAKRGRRVHLCMEFVPCIQDFLPSQRNRVSTVIDSKHNCVKTCQLPPRLLAQSKPVTGATFHRKNKTCTKII